MVKARANPFKVPGGLKKWSSDQALASELGLQVALQKEHVRFKGEPASNPVVDGVRLGKSKRVLISDCHDNSAWLPVDSRTGKSRAAANQPQRIWTDIEVRWYDGRWTVMRATADRDKSC